jgi:hypothetical protein
MLGYSSIATQACKLTYLDALATRLRSETGHRVEVVSVDAAVPAYS